jgi:rod shape-determining protein MreC
MKGFLERIHLETLQPWIALAVAIVFSLMLMATSENRGTEVARVQFTEILVAFSRPFTVIPAIMNLHAENARLRAENTQLRIDSQKEKEARLENDRLRRLLEFKASTSLILRPAEVVGKNPMPGVHSLLINAGSSLGIAKHMAVINDRGLLGQVVRVSSHTAVVQLLTDRNTGAAVRLSDCRADGVTSWAGDDRLMIDGIASQTPVHVGEEIITSGLDGIFPAGLPVGQVVRTEKSRETFFLQVEMKPAVDFSAVEEVFVVWDSGPFRTP